MDFGEALKELRAGEWVMVNEGEGRPDDPRKGMHR